jgi:DNA-binding protein HU-beta
MNRQELLQDISQRLGNEISKAKLDRILGALQDSVADSLRRGEAVTLVGWGTWRLHRRPAREGRNPTTGKPLTIAAAQIPKWTAGTAFRAAMSTRIQPGMRARRQDEGEAPARAG